MQRVLRQSSCPDALFLFTEKSSEPTAYCIVRSERLSRDVTWDRTAWRSVAVSWAYILQAESVAATSDNTFHSSVEEKKNSASDCKPKQDRVKCVCGGFNAVSCFSEILLPVELLRLEHVWASLTLEDKWIVSGKQFVLCASCLVNGSFTDDSHGTKQTNDVWSFEKLLLNFLLRQKMFNAFH